MLPMHQPKKHASSSEQKLAAPCRRAPGQPCGSGGGRRSEAQSAAGAVLDTAQNHVSFPFHRGKENAAVGLENSFHRLYGNQNGLCVFKMAPGGHLAAWS